jgi:hypothetical protein
MPKLRPKKKDKYARNPNNKYQILVHKKMGDKPKIYVKIYDTLLDAKTAKQGFLNRRNNDYNIRH